jgi:hypothetical protein
MPAFGQEPLEASLCFGNRVGRCNADSIKAMLARGTRERLLERGRIAQKSRSA